MKPALAVLVICLLPVAAAADDSTSAATAQNSGPMVVQQMHSTFLVAPDFKISRLDGTTARIAGVYGGILLDENWLVGAGGYWLTNGSAGRSLGYGGPIVGWMSDADQPIGFSVRTLIGWGDSRLGGTITEPVLTFPNGTFDGFGPDHLPRPIPAPIVTTRTVPVRFRQQFFVAEPQADVIFRVASWGRIDAGAGYRAIGAADGFEHRLRGATASISLQIGSF